MTDLKPTYEELAEALRQLVDAKSMADCGVTMDIDPAFWHARNIVGRIARSEFPSLMMRRVTDCETHSESKQEPPMTDLK